MQRRVIRIIMGCGYREFCRELIKELKLLPLSSQYIFSLLFVVNNGDYFVSHSVYHNNNTKQRNTIIPKKKLFTLASGKSGHVSEGKSLMVFPRQSSTLCIHTHCIVLMNFFNKH
jgi:hypothetical protein